MSTDRRVYHYRTETLNVSLSIESAQSPTLQLQLTPARGEYGADPEEVGHDTRDNYIPEHGQREMYWKKRFFLEKCFSGGPQADSSETLVYCSK